jgi:hypothetical protein
MGQTGETGGASDTGKMSDQSKTTPGGSRTITLTLDEAERDLIALALGELLSSTTRDEHIIPAVQALLARVHAPTTLESAPT